LWDKNISFHVHAPSMDADLCHVVGTVLWKFMNG